MDGEIKIPDLFGEEHIEEYSGEPDNNHNLDLDRISAQRDVFESLRGVTIFFVENGLMPEDEALVHISMIDQAIDELTFEEANIFNTREIPPELQIQYVDPKSD